ncbi:hypothetical protein ACOSYY_12750 [Nitrospira sp. BLG_2]
MEETFRQAYLEAFGFDAVVQQGEEVGKSVIGTIRHGSEAKLFLGMVLLRCLINEVPHVFFEQTNDVSRKHNRLSHAPLSSFFMGRIKIGLRILQVAIGRLIFCVGRNMRPGIGRGYTWLTRYERRPLVDSLMFGRVGVPAHYQLYAFS